MRFLMVATYSDWYMVGLKNKMLKIVFASTEKFQEF